MSLNNNVHDPLLECLGIVSRLHEREFSAESAIAGLPLEDGRLTPSLLTRAAELSGFSARIRQIQLAKIGKMVLPVILILKDNNACVLQGAKKDTYEIILSESGGEKSISAKELMSNYSGYAVFLEPSYEYDRRTEEFQAVSPRSWFWDTMFQYKSVYSHVLIAAFLTNLFVLVAPLFILNVYDRVVPNQAFTTLWVLALGALVFFVFDLTARLLRHYLVDFAGRKADEKLSNMLYSHMLSLRMAEKPDSSGVVANYFNEFQSLRDFFTSATFIGLIDLPFIFLFLFVTWLIGGPIVFVPLTALPIILSIALLLEIPARASVQQSMAGESQKQSIIVESFNGLETIKTINAENLMQKKWERHVKHESEAAGRSRFYSALILNLTVWVQQIVIIGVIVVGVYLIISGDLTVGGLIAVTILSGRALMVGQVANLLSRIERSKAALRGLNHIMQAKTDRNIKSTFLRRPHVKGNIELDKVTFFYPGERNAALENISISIQAGERVGVIGRIGSGKSTLLKLMVGLYEPTEGSVLIDGTDNADIDPKDLRRNIHYVNADSLLFYGTVRENIRMANQQADDDALLRAAKIAGVDKFVNQHPSGFDMPVGERGQWLSAGQRQAICLARAVIANPSVLLLDEPTGAVDNSFEQEFMSELPTVLGNKTLIVVTHRSSLLQLVDRIIVLEGGHVVADGPRDVILDRLMGAGPQKPSAGQSPAQPQE